MPDTAEAVATRRHEKFERLVAQAQQYPPMTVAVAHPCDKVSLESAAEGAATARDGPWHAPAEHGSDSVHRD